MKTVAQKSQEAYLLLNLSLYCQDGQQGLLQPQEYVKDQKVGLLSDDVISLLWVQSKAYSVQQDCAVFNLCNRFLQRCF